MERNGKEFYAITQGKNFSGDMKFDTEKQALEHLKAILHEESNYNYLANKNNTYILYQAIYNENTGNYDYYEILPKISVIEYRNMTMEEKDLYFSEGKKNE